MTLTSRIMATLLVGLMLVTAQSAAVARTMPDAEGQFILCTGTGPVMVYVDAEGNPTSAPHLCPDHALSLILDLEQPAIVLSADGHWAGVRFDLPASEARARHARRAQARGPPA